MTGAVLLIGSLLWENSSNAINKENGILRASWRGKIDLDNKITVKVPIRYGRISSLRRMTYTMVFSNSVPELGTAFIIPFKDGEYKGGITETLIAQAKDLALAEGIATDKNDRIISKWGCIGISFNKKCKKDYSFLKDYWKDLFTSLDTNDYRLGSETTSIKKCGELNFDLDIPESIDYVLTTLTKPTPNDYPSIDQIIKAIHHSVPRYDTYFHENMNNNIRVYNDLDILEELKKL